MHDETHNVSFPRKRGVIYQLTDAQHIQGSTPTLVPAKIDFACLAYQPAMHPIWMYVKTL
jgi:hypothetical protein